jgi:hypothetical protein
MYDHWVKSLEREVFFLSFFLSLTLLVPGVAELAQRKAFLEKRMPVCLSLCNNNNKI